MKQYIFFREHNGKPMFYQVEYSSDDEAVAGAIHNAGTTKVETMAGLQIYPATKHQFQPRRSK